MEPVGVTDSPTNHCKEENASQHTDEDTRAKNKQKKQLKAT